ncbi:MAG: DUF4333 domain-containing protein [Pseudoclavibacter sp.]
MTPRSSLLALGGALAATTLALTGCSFSSSVQVPADEAAAQAAAALEPQLGYAPEISCPQDLEAEVGHELVCELVDDAGEPHDVTLTVTEVGDDGYVDFDVSVG